VQQLTEAMMGNPIFILSGAPGSGKSTVSQALLRRFDFGLHVPVDALREWVVSGLSNPVPGWSNETDRQFRLARRTAAAAARIYAEDGFAVAIDDVIFPSQVKSHYRESLVEFRLHKVMLRPDVETTRRRNNARLKEFDTT
jgi:chloramphenicol 3-O-phosphotransferase